MNDSHRVLFDLNLYSRFTRVKGVPGLLIP